MPKKQTPENYDRTKYYLEDVIIRNTKVGIVVLPINDDVSMNGGPRPKRMWVKVRDVGYELVLVYSHDWEKNPIRNFVR